MKGRCVWLNDCAMSEREFTCASIGKLCVGNASALCQEQGLGGGSAYSSIALSYDWRGGPVGDVVQLRGAMDHCDPPRSRPCVCARGWRRTTCGPHYTTTATTRWGIRAFRHSSFPVDLRCAYGRPTPLRAKSSKVVPLLNPKVGNVWFGR